jgi:hypothetical protein
MPYGSISEAEKKNPGLGKYSDKAKRGWLSAFNGCLDDGKSESSCFAIAYSVANKVQGKKSASDRRKLAREILGLARELINGPAE